MLIIIDNNPVHPVCVAPGRRRRGPLDQLEPAQPGASRSGPVAAHAPRGIQGDQGGHIRPLRGRGGGEGPGGTY